MKAALICTLGPDVEARRLELRASHLGYVAQHRSSIVFGGPTLSAEGRPERMLIILDVPDLAAAHAFVAAEPYSANGVFEQVEVRAWSQVLPEAEPGALERALALQRARAD